jgi:AraC-like DNA-binding protein
MRFSTASLPEQQRVAMMRDFYGPLVARVDLEPASDDPFYFEATARACPGLTVVDLVSSPVHLWRNRKLLDGDDRVTLSLTLAGSGSISHVGRELTRAVGSGFLCSHADEFNSTIPIASHHINVSVPRGVLAELVPRLNDHFMRPIAPQSEVLRLIIDYVTMLGRDHTLTSAALRQLAVTHVHDLVALALGASRDAAEVARNRGLRAARLHAIKADIVALLALPDLSLVQIATRHGITPRYVQALFEQEGTSFSKYLLDERLQLVYRMLRDPVQQIRSVSTIAFAAGFGDLSHFNRAFRRRYGATPSDVRGADLS